MRIAFLPRRARSGVFAGMTSIRGRVGRQTERAGDRGAAPAEPLDLQGSADQARARVHRTEPDAGGGEGLLGNSDAVVLDPQKPLPTAAAETDLDPFSPSVVDGVVDGFLSDAKEMQLDVG